MEKAIKKNQLEFKLKDLLPIMGLFSFDERNKDVDVSFSNIKNHRLNNLHTLYQFIITSGTGLSLLYVAHKLAEYIR